MQLARADSALRGKSCDKGEVQGSGARFKDVTLGENHNAAFTLFPPPPAACRVPEKKMALPG